jgi:quercetin dioxygenase-like cupin family protein
MQITSVLFQTIDWDEVPIETHLGKTGFAYWKTVIFKNIRLRVVEYSPGYFADHWCSKGHIIFCLEGEMITELQDGRKFKLSKNMNYIVGDGIEPHRSYSEDGVKLFIVD